MKCQKCGAEIPANSLYCLECGEDIHIVPDFEPEIDMNLEKALNSIVEEVFEEAKAPTCDLSPEEETPKTAPWAVGGKMFSLWIPLIIFEK